jgi:hypothetical protein
MRIIPFPVAHDDRHGTVCVMGDKVEGFLVAHESRSGNSWGAFHGPFSDGQAAIEFAYAFNRDEYRGECNVSVCDAARDDWCRDVGLVDLPHEIYRGDF